MKATSECRAAAGVCDAAEICDGVSDDCPADAPAPNGTPCDDANACTQTDRCQLGACVGVDPIVCAPDDCHEAGLCDPLSGACSSSPAPDGLLCDDGDPTTFDDACQSGTCEGLSPPCDASLYEPELTFLHGGPAGQSWLVSVCKLPDAVDPAAAATRSYSSACSAEAGVMDVTTWSNPDKSLFVNGLAAAALDQIGPSALTSQNGYPDQSPYFAGQPWTVVALLGTDKTAVTHQSANSCSCNAYDFTVTGQDSVDHRMVAMNFWQHPSCSTTGYNPVLGPVWDQSYRAAVWPGYAANDVGVTPIYAYYNGDCSLCLGAPAPIFKASDVPYGAASACGRGPNESYATRVACALPVPPIDVAAGESHACAVMADGRVYCWGANHHGQLGDGTFTTRTRPVQVLGIDNAVSVALGSWHSCALLKTGEVRCWGYNTHGNLGRGTSSSAEVVPAAVVGITDAVALSSRYNHACVVRAGGAVACWGYNYSGAVGGSASPAFPHGVLSPRPVSGVASAVAVATGAQMSCAVLQGGGVTCWGDNAQGQLGDGTTVPHVTPAPVLGLSDALALTAGLNHVCAIRANHALVCWGANASGQLGNGTTVDGHLPTPVPGLTRVRRIDAGWHHTCASDAYGRAWCWGDNTQGELGTGGYGLSPLPVAVASSGTVRALAAGSDTGDIGSPQRFSCAVVDDQLECWGRNAWGQLGDGTFVDHPAPAAVLAP